ncbi:MAG: protein kinase [Verrucomicrobia bacterium]|nr:protein kinase [Verrucomicrobiota bacterium]
MRPPPDPSTASPEPADPVSSLIRQSPLIRLPERKAAVTLRYGNYRVLTREDGTPWRLGAGSMGITYKAWDERLEITVALKVITPLLLHDATSQALFLREARLAARVRDAHVASVLALDDTPGASFYAMEFVPGVTLAEFLRPRGRLRPDLALELAGQIMEALAAVHAEGLVHRDLKPANLMILPDPAGEGPGEHWLIKVIDFGLARSFEQRTRDDETVPGGTAGFRGTALYASPEQCAERRLLDGRADQYAAGCVLWEMLTGAPPFLAFTHRELIGLHLKAPLPLEAVKRLPESVRAILVRLLAKEPEARFPDARAAAEAMRTARAALTPAEACEILPPSPVQAETAIAGAETTLAPARPPAWRRRLELAVFALVACAAVAAWWLQLARPAAPPSASAATTPEKSIAVLPFENLAVEKENEFFAVGLHEDVLTTLAKMAELRVISRSSVQGFRGSAPRELREIGQKLGVRYVLEGSVQRAGGKLRISTRLSETSTGAQVWAQRFDREVGDLFAVQSEVAEAVATQLKVQLTDATRAALAQRATTALPAYFLYVRALSVAEDNFDQVGSKAAILQSVKLLEEAIALDPAFLQAHCQLAKNHDALYWLNHDRTPARRALATAAVERAEKLAPKAGLTQLTRARHAFWGFRDFAKAKEYLALAVRSEPNHAEIPQLLGSVERRLGRWAEATEQFERALQLDPRSQLNRWLLTTTLRFQRRYDEAARSAALMLELVPKDVELQVLPDRLVFDRSGQTAPLRQRLREILAAQPRASANLAALSLDLALCERDAATAREAARDIPPEGFTWVEDVMPFPHAWFEALAASLAGETDAATRLFSQAREVASARLRELSDNPNGQMVLALIEAGLGRREEALRLARAASAALPLEQDAVDGAQLLYQLAAVASACGEVDEAIRTLSRIATLPGPLTHGQLKLHPKWDPLRADPRFQALVASLAR